MDFAIYDLYDVVHIGHVVKESTEANKEWKERSELWNEKFSTFVQENEKPVASVQGQLLELQEEGMESEVSASTDENGSVTEVSLGEEQPVVPVVAPVEA